MGVLTRTTVRAVLPEPIVSAGQRGQVFDARGPLLDQRPHASRAGDAAPVAAAEQSAEVALSFHSHTEPVSFVYLNV